MEQLWCINPEENDLKELVCNNFQNILFSEHGGYRTVYMLHYLLYKERERKTSVYACVHACALYAWVCN